MSPERKSALMSSRVQPSYPVPLAHPASLKPVAALSPDTLSRQARQAEDMSGAYSSGYGDYCPEGIPVEQAIFGVLAAFAASFGFLFRAITQITDPARKRRDLRAGGGQPESLLERIQAEGADMFWLGRFATVKQHARLTNELTFLMVGDTNSDGTNLALTHF